MWTDKDLVAVADTRMAVVDRGEGATTFLLLHGNPTSSFLWRDVLPHLVLLGRCVVPDLVGMGDSDKLPGSGPGRYGFDVQQRHVDALLERLALGDRIVLVLHDWGSALGFDWARRHAHRVVGIAHMESLVAPLETAADLGEDSTRALRRNRTPDGERMVLDENVLVEHLLPAFVLRDLTETEMQEYRRPFASGPEDRRVILDLNRDVPYRGEPADVAGRIRAYGDWLASSDVPKLLVRAEPGFLLRGRLLEVARAWPATSEVVVAGHHFPQEDSGEAIGREITSWYERRVARQRGTSIPSA